MIKRTWQPKKLKRARKFGFMERMNSGDGKRILSRRRNKGRTKLVTA